MTVRVPGRYDKDLTKFQAAVEQIAQGRVNCTGTVTLTPSATTTTVDAPTVAPGTVVLLGPETANAAGALATTYVKTSDVSQGSFVVTHANGTSSDRIFGWAAFG